MKALGITSRPEMGNLSNSIQELEIPIPTPNKNEVLIKVYAATIKIDDIYAAQGSIFGGISISPKPSEKKPLIPGLDVAGIIDKVGSGVTNFKVGEAVFGMCNPFKNNGSWAEYCLVKKDWISIKPQNINFNQASAFASGGAVVVSSIKAAGIVKNEKCLVIGASGGIGTLCVQALKLLGANVWGVCSHKNAKMVKDIGATKIFDYTKSPFDEQIKNISETVDIVLDFVGGRDIEKQAMSILKPKGKFITVVGPEKYIGQTKLGILKIVSISLYIGYRILFSKLFSSKKYIMTGPSPSSAPDFKSIVKLFIEPRIEPKIDRIIPLNKNEVSEAIMHIASHRASGRVIIKINGE